MKAWLCITFLLLAPRALRAGVYAEYDVKADFVERFTRYVEWPPDRRPEADQPFIACVWGEAPIWSRLQSMETRRRFKDRRLEVQKPGIDGLARCHLLWIGATDPTSLTVVLAALNRRPVLTIADSAGFAERGVMINLRTDGGQVRFQINRAAAESAGLRLSAQLLRLGEPVGAVP